MCVLLLYTLKERKASGNSEFIKFTRMLRYSTCGKSNTIFTIDYRRKMFFGYRNPIGFSCVYLYFITVQN